MVKDWPIGAWYYMFINKEWMWYNYFHIEGTGWVSQLDCEWTEEVNRS